MNGWSSSELNVRVELATAYRIAAMLGWEHIIHTHITAKIPNTEHFLINPYGLLFEEVTASNLVKVDVSGNVVDPGSAAHLPEYCGINPAGWRIHAAIHASERSKSGETDFVWHTHHPASIAVSAMPCGLLLGLSIFSMDVGPIAYHDFQHVVAGDEVCKKLIQDFGTTPKCLMLRNHGLITIGKTICEAFYLMYGLSKACEIQVMAMNAGVPESKLIVVPTEIREENYKIGHDNYTGVSYGLTEWNAMKRRLDCQFQLKSTFKLNVDT